MYIKKITGTNAFVPYGAPVGPYRGRTAKDEGTLGGSGLIVKIETDTGLIGWGEGRRGRFETDPNTILAGDHVGDIEKTHDKLVQAGINMGAISGIEMALWDLIGKQADLPIYHL